MTRILRPWEADEIFGRVLVIASFLHAAGNFIVFLALDLMTRGGGDGKRDTPSIEAAILIWQGLGAPLRWAIQMLIDPNWHNAPTLWMEFVLRLMNSLVVGAGTAWIYVAYRRKALQRAWR